MALMNGSELAKALGVSRSCVSQYKLAGRIQEEPSGGYVLEHVKEQLMMTLGTKRGGLPRRGEGLPEVLSESSLPGTPAVHRLERPRTPVGNVRDQGSKAELEREALRERIRRERFRNDEAERRLIDRAAVEAATEARFRLEAEALLTFPDRFAADMAAELGVNHLDLLRILKRIIREFMTERSNVPAAAAPEPETEIDKGN